MGFRFIHSADLHLGRRFGHLPEAARGRLVEARHGVIDRLAQAARAHGAGHILVAGDVFDTETPSDAVWRQALAAMGADAGISWWLIPGNHDSLAAEGLWSRFRRGQPANVRLIANTAPIEIAPSAWLLAAPLPRRYPGSDLTAHMPGLVTEPGALRIGLAHGAIRGFSDQSLRDDEIIPPDRARSAGLDYLALGDWHGHLRVDERTWYAGTPERDGFGHDGPGVCLAVTVPGPGAAPAVAPVPTGRHLWADREIALVPGQAGDVAMQAALPADRVARRDHVMRLRLTGRATLAEQAALDALAAAAAPDFCHFVCDAAGLTTEFETADLDRIDRAGALRAAAEMLRDTAEDEAADAAGRRVAAAALNRLYGYLHEDRA